jgi:hypothetical protein
VPDEGLDRCPVHESRLLASTAEKPAAQTAGSRVDACDDPSRILVAQLNVVSDDEPPGVHADKPAAEDIVTEQHFPLPSLEMSEVEVLTGELDTAGFHRGNPVTGNEQLPPGDASDQAGDRRIAALGESGDDIVHPAEPAARSINERAVQDPGKCQPDRFGGWLPGV